MVSRHHQVKPKTTETKDGNYAVFLSPGTYHFTASAGDAACPVVTVTVVSGRTTTAQPSSAKENNHAIPSPESADWLLLIVPVQPVMRETRSGHSTRPKISLTTAFDKP